MFPARSFSNPLPLTPMPYELHPNGTRTQLRATFDQVAQAYDVLRPSYPDAVFDDVMRISAVPAAAHLLEIGCGTGHATQALAARGFSIHAIELGEQMAALARRRLAAFPSVCIQVADFDTWTTAERFSLVCVATAFHWLNPATREARIAAALQPNGWLAIWRNRHIRNGSSDDFLDETRIIYREEAPEIYKRRAQLSSPDQVFESERDAISRDYFSSPILRRYLWSLPCTASDYVQLLNTHSDHQLLPADRRNRLFDRIANLIDTRYGGSVTKDYATLLQMLQKQS